MHEIRLAGPWESQDVADPSAVWRRIVLPLVVGQSGPFRLRRRFHRPSGLSASTRLYVRLVSSAGSTCIRLNGEAIDPPQVSDEGHFFDVTARMQPFNELLFEGTADQANVSVLDAAGLRIVEEGDQC